MLLARYTAQLKNVFVWGKFGTHYQCGNLEVLRPFVVHQNVIVNSCLLTVVNLLQALLTSSPVSSVLALLPCLRGALCVRLRLLLPASLTFSAGRVKITERHL